MGKIIRILNHNAIIIHDLKNKRVLLLLGKGIGFGKHINETVDRLPLDGQIYELKQKTSKGDTKDILRNIDPMYLEISSDIIALAEKEFGQIDRNILLPMADHIAFAIVRIKNDKNIANPFANDIRLLYPSEYRIAKEGCRIIYDRTGYQIDDDEAGYITLHIHSALGERVDEGMLVAVIVRESIAQVETECGIRIDDNSLSYNRLLTHMKYLMARIREKEILSLDMGEYTKSHFPYSYDVAEHIIERIARTINQDVPKVEIGYLAMHIERVRQSEMGDKGGT